jgi:hypothetical protein
MCPVRSVTYLSGRSFEYMNLFRYTIIGLAARASIGTTAEPPKESRSRTNAIRCLSETFRHHFAKPRAVMVGHFPPFHKEARGPCGVEWGRAKRGGVSGVLAEGVGLFVICHRSCVTHTTREQFWHWPRPSRGESDRLKQLCRTATLSLSKWKGVAYLKAAHINLVLRTVVCGHIGPAHGQVRCRQGRRVGEPAHQLLFPKTAISSNWRLFKVASRYRVFTSA